MVPSCRLHGEYFVLSLVFPLPDTVPFGLCLEGFPAVASDCGRPDLPFLILHVMVFSLCLELSFLIL